MDVSRNPERPIPAEHGIDNLLTPEQVSETLAVPVATLYRWRLTGYGPKAIKIGKHLRWRKATLDTWLADQENAG